MKKRAGVFALLALLSALTSCVLLDPGRSVRLYASSTSGSVLGNYLCGGIFSSFSQASPWSIEMEAEKGDMVILTAGSGSGPGAATVRIFVDGGLIKEATGQTSAIIQISVRLE